MTELPLSAPQVLNRSHQTANFDCGKTPLNEFLRLYALTNAQSGNSRTFVVVDAHSQVVGYYSLAAISIEHDGAPQRLRQGQPLCPIPAISMAHFAEDLSDWQ